MSPADLFGPSSIGGMNEQPVEKGPFPPLDFRADLLDFGDEFRKSFGRQCRAKVDSEVEVIEILKFRFASRPSILDRHFVSEWKVGSQPVLIRIEQYPDLLSRRQRGDRLAK